MSEPTIPMTPACAETLRAELRRIKEVDRPENVREIEVAREHGDLSENAEYLAAKERQGNIDARLRYVEYRLARAQIIDPTTIKSRRAGFGATVTLLDVETDEEVRYSLVGEDESDAGRGRISITSPLARAIVGKSEGDAVVANLPKGDREFEVVKVEYVALDSPHSSASA